MATNAYEYQPQADSSLQSPVYSPDYSFLQTQLYKSNQQYEQGEKEVVSGYSSVLAQPTLGDAAAQKKQEYIAQVQEGLKKIAPSDLSLPQNVAQAESLYAPFWQDSALLQNTASAKEYQNNVQKIQSGLFSTDDKQRALYDPIQLQDQEGYRRDVEEAGLDPDKQRMVQRRSVTPFRNFRDALNAAAGKDGVELNWDELANGGQNIVTYTNGQRSVKNFSTWASAVLSGSDWSSQFQTIGRVAVDRMKQQIKQTNPNITPDQMNGEIAKYTVNRLQESYTNNLADTNLDIANTQKQIDIIKNRGVKGKPTSADMPLYNLLTQQLQQTQGLLAQQKLQQDNFVNGDRDRKLRDISSNPQDYFADIEKSNVINNYASGEAAKEGREIKDNPAYAAAATNQRLWAEFNYKKNTFDPAEFAIKRGQLQLNAEEQARLNAVAGYDPNTNTMKPGYGPAGAGTVANVLTGTPAKDEVNYKEITNPYDKYQMDMQKNLTTAHDLMWGSDNAAKLLIGKSVNIDRGGVRTTEAVTATDIDVTNRALLNKKADPNYKYTPKEMEGLARVGAAIGANAHEYTDPAAMEAKLEMQLGKEELDKNGVPTTDSRIASRKITEAKQLAEKTSSLNKQVKDNVNAILLNSEREHPELVQHNPDGTKRLTTATDIAATLPALEVKNAKTGEITKVSPEDLAKGLYMNGSIKMNDGLTYHPSGLFTSNADLTINGEDYVINKVTPPPGTVVANVGPHGVEHTPAQPIQFQDYGFYHVGTEPNNRRDVHGAMMSFVNNNKYGDPEKFHNTIQNAQHSAVDNLAGYQSDLLERGVSQTYNMLNKVQQATVNKLTSDLADPSNRSASIPGITGEQLPVLSQILREGGDGYIQSSIYRPYGGPGGTPAMEVTFTSNDKKAPTAPVTKGIDEIVKMGTIMIPIKEDASSKELQQLMHSAGNTSYSDMYTGTKYSSNDIQKAHNYNYTLEPIGLVNGRYTRVHVTCTGKQIDPHTGHLEDYLPFRQYGDEGKGIDIDLSKQTPYQIKKEIDDFFDSYLTANINNYSAYAKSHNNANFQQLEHQQ
jgi:hypothetical protein